METSFQMLNVLSFGNLEGGLHHKPMTDRLALLIGSLIFSQDLVQLE